MYGKLILFMGGVGTIQVMDGIEAGDRDINALELYKGTDGKHPVPVIADRLFANFSATLPG